MSQNVLNFFFLKNLTEIRIKIFQSVDTKWVFYCGKTTSWISRNFQIFVKKTFPNLFEKTRKDYAEFSSFCGVNDTAKSAFSKCFQHKYCTVSLQSKQNSKIIYCSTVCYALATGIQITWHHWLQEKYANKCTVLSIIMKYLHEEDKLFTSNSKKQFWVFTAIFWHIFHLLLDPDSGSKRLQIWIQEAKWTHGSGYEKLILNDQSFICTSLLTRQELI